MPAAWTKGAGFRICGVITKDPFVRDNFARLSVGVPGRKGETKIDLVTFDGDVIAQIRPLGIGATVQVTGGVEMECVKGKDREPVLVDGYKKWVPLLVAKKVELEAADPNAPKYGGPDDKGW